MRLLLDESLPRRLKNLLDPHQVETAQDRGWAETTNGELLRLAESVFDVFITADQNLEYQQNLAGYGLGVIVVVVLTTRLSDPEPLIPRVLEVLPQVQVGEVHRVAL